MTENDDDVIDQEMDIREPLQFIRGAFVFCERVKQNKRNGEFLIKLSSINTIVPQYEKTSDGNEWCLFYTYKDCCYITWVDYLELRKAINSCMFKPDDHFENYPD